MKPSRRLVLLASCALAFFSLSGCSNVSERLAGWYVTRRLDSYADFTSEQKARARASVDETLLMLRKEELPHWITFLREVRAGMHDGLDDAAIARLQGRYDERLDRAVDLLVPRAAPLLAELDARQHDHFAKRMREELDDRYEDLELPTAKRLKKLEERALDSAEDFVGDLSDAQEEQLRALVRGIPDEWPRQHRSAVENIAHFRAFMAQKPSASAVDAELHAMWAHRYDGLGVGHDKASRRKVQRGFLLAVYRMLTPKQRAHAEEELSDRIRALKRWTLPASGG